jgi:hypothetical protein
MGIVLPHVEWGTGIVLSHGELGTGIVLPHGELGLGFVLPDEDRCRAKFFQTGTGEELFTA